MNFSFTFYFDPTLKSPVAHKMIVVNDGDILKPATKDNVLAYCGLRAFIGYAKYVR